MKKEKTRGLIGGGGPGGGGKSQFTWSYFSGI